MHLNQDTLDFQKPEPNSAFIALCKFLLPFYSRFNDLLTFKIADNGAVANLEQKNTVILLNHSDRQDPLVVLALAKHFNEEFYVLAAREIFDWHHGMLGWMLRKFGCYSINRGIADHKSLEETKRILKQSKRKLVIFPEAEITADERKIHKISTSLIHIFLDAQNELSRDQPDKAIWILPVGVSYHLKTTFKTSVEKSINIVEKQIGLEPSDASSIARIDSAIQKVLTDLFHHYKIEFPDDLPKFRQVDFLIERICDRIAHFLGNETEFQTVEKMQYALRNDVRKLLRKTAHSDNERQLEKNNQLLGHEFISDLDRVERLTIFSRVLQQPTSEIQMCRILDFLEMETTGKITSKGQQEATIHIASPIRIADFIGTYESDRRSAISNLHDTVHETMQLALNLSQKEF